ncbi:MAG: beta-propeller fold lactonase family protein [Gemmatimonadaceae bacterium]|nr:beta-propeller fold lactonase family protein [Gemmatimonadaceae bacterium]
MHTILLPVTSARKSRRHPVSHALVTMAVTIVFTALPPVVTTTVAQGTPGAASPAAAPAAPRNDYWVYVGAESADKIYRVRFGPAGTVVEKAIAVGELAAEMEGPHGLAISRDRKYLYMTTGHGNPDGKLWRYELGPDTLAGRGILLGNFPASLDVTPDGLYSFSANFNLHGDMIPSTVSVVYTPTQTEVARIVTCTMPHGSRISPDGMRQYSTCMMDDQLVEIDPRDFAVSRRFPLAKGREGPLAKDVGSTMAGMGDMAGMKHDMAVMSHDVGAGSGAKSAGKPATATVDPAQVGRAGMGIEKHTMAPASCSPTWAQPSVNGDRVWVACNKADEIIEIDSKSWTLTRRLKTGRGVYNLAVTPDGRLLVATLKPGSSIEIFDIASGRSLAQIKTTNTLAHGITVSSDSKYAFVSSEGVGAAPGKVDVFDLVAFAKVGTADVGQQASGIAFWKMN